MSTNKFLQSIFLAVVKYCPPYWLGWRENLKSSVCN